jgi:hypothetical protein
LKVGAGGTAHILPNVVICAGYLLTIWFPIVAVKQSQYDDFHWLSFYLCGWPEFC